MPDWSRQTALLTMTSSLGPDVLIPTALAAHEAISQCFAFDVEVVSQQDYINPADLLNKPACVTLQSSGSPVRSFHGIVQTLSAESAIRGQTGSDSYRIYRLTMVPRLWFLNQTTDCRVYLAKSTDDILRDMFQDAGLSDFNIIPSGAVREYTVQFNETDLQFATRLMEEEGWFYFFQHETSKHTVVVANQNSAFTDIAGATLHLGGGTSEGTLVTTFHVATATVHGKSKTKDYDPEKPDTVLQDEQPTTLTVGGSDTRDAFRWPALTASPDVVTDRAKYGIEAAEAAASLYDGATRFGSLVPGGKFTLASRPADPKDDDYVVRSISHHATDDTWLSKGGSATYACRFTCFPAKTPWRQPMVTPRPRMDGIHTALVMGPQHSVGSDIKSQSGEEIQTDAMGRVRVRFYWDHRAEATGGGAVWARVIQPWAGKGWGAQFFPRVGTEVAVAFVDGDPDRPMVIGGLYNGRDTPIYAVADKNKSGIRTRSVPSGGAANFNEFTFDDTSGSELVFLHAEKDLTTEVEHDQTLTVDNCRIVSIKKDETVEIGQNRSVTIDQGNDSLELKSGNLSIKADAGKIDVQAMQSITLTVGSNSIKIDQTGVAINGIQVKIAGTAMTTVKAPMTQVSGDGMLTLKGGIMMLN